MMGNVIAALLNFLAVVLLFMLAPEEYLIVIVLIILNILSLSVNLSQIIFKNAYENS